MRFRGLAEATAVLTAALVLACLLTYPYAFKFGRAGRVDTNDGRWSIWVVSWVAHALTTDPLQVYRANIFYPHRDALAYSEANLAAGALGAPVWLLTKNPYATHNFVVLLSFIVSSAGAYYLCRYLTGSRPAAAVASVLFAYCPFVFARTAHIQLLLIGGLPFCMLALHRLVDRTTAGRAVALGAILWFQGLACAYYGIFGGLAVGAVSLVLAITRGRWRDWRYWAGIAGAAVVSIGLTLPFFIPYINLQRDTGFARSLDGARTYSANAAAWLASGAWAHRWWLDAIPSRTEVLFPGIVTVILGVAGAWIGLRTRAAVPESRAPLYGVPHVDESRAPLYGVPHAVPESRAPLYGVPHAVPESRAPLYGVPHAKVDRGVVLSYVVTAILAFWITFGPKAGLYSVLYAVVPVFTFLRAPGRTGIVVTLCLAVLASIAVARLLERRRHPWLIAVGLMALAVADLVQAPIGLRDAAPTAPAHAELSRQHVAPVAVFPFWARGIDFHGHAEYMLASTAHWLPLINGYSDHIPQDFRDNAAVLRHFPNAASFALLERLGARYVVIHLQLYAGTSRDEVIGKLDSYVNYLRPLEKDGDIWLFEIVGWPR